MNLKKIAILVFIILSAFLFYKYYVEKKNENNRWYTKEQVSFGKEIFLNNCASCHGKEAEKTINWKKTLPDGSYPPPPLNDKAHAWHHPKWQLMKIIKNGGGSYGGKMPAFKDTLSDKEIEAAIAYFQSFWADEFYDIWSDSRKGLESNK